MKKQILNIGKTLSRSEQQKINGGVHCLQCDSYCFANNPNDAAGFQDCFLSCINQYC